MYRWVPRCLLCGRTGSGNTNDDGKIPPHHAPKVPGACPYSPNGKHVSRWERDERMDSK